ncbi:MAG: hypothetical protein IKX19_07040, partial [Clostridia bacterium]|nr:hypothetical protein [Clostridia bacterium]
VKNAVGGSGKTFMIRFLKNFKNTEMVNGRDKKLTENNFFLDRVTEFTRSRFFKGTIAAIIVLSILYVFIKAALREKRIRRMSGRR